MRRQKLVEWLPLALLALVMGTGLRPVVLGGVQRGLLATGLWRAEAPAVPAQAAAAPTPVAAGPSPYPHNLAMRTADGRPVRLRDLRGKAVFVNLWASWCPPCRAEMPGIEALYRKVDKSKVAFVMLSLDEEPAKAQKFFASQGYTFPLFFGNGELPAPFNSSTIPSTIILGPDGRLAARHDGMADYDTPDFKAALEALAAGSK